MCGLSGSRAPLDTYVRTGNHATPRLTNRGSETDAWHDSASRMHWTSTNVVHNLSAGPRSQSRLLRVVADRKIIIGTWAWHGVAWFCLSIGLIGRDKSVQSSSTSLKYSRGYEAGICRAGGGDASNRWLNPIIALSIEKICLDACCDAELETGQ